MASPYGIPTEELLALNANKDSQNLKGKWGGVSGIAKVLNTDLKHGLSQEGTGLDSVESHRTVYGPNTYKQVPPKSFWSILLEAYKDPVILLLCAAALLSTVLGSAIPEERHEGKWIEGVAIWVAIFLVTGVSSVNDYQKDLQFRKLNEQRDVIDVKVVRNGNTVVIKNGEVVVGDILMLDTGDKVVADGVVTESFGLVLDEASLTGESDPIKKNEEDPWCRSGTQVSEGSGKILVLAVGDNSEWGKTIGLVTSSGDEMTPLQEKLAHVAATVGKIGATVAATCFIALLIKWCVINQGFPLSKINQNGPVQFFLYSVTIVVVAIPEGLPLAVTMALAYSMKKMMRDQNFVRVLAACETMGGATAICSDKTGTLTENRMTVTEGWFGGKSYDHAPAAEELSEPLRKKLELNFALNSKAFLVEHGEVLEFVGNRTECALLVLGKKWGSDYKATREEFSGGKIEQMYQFTSAKKMASVLVNTGDNYLLLNKGAAEWVLQKCDFVADAEGNATPLSETVRAQILDTVVAMASRGLRCICLAERVMPLHDASRPADFFDDSANCDQKMTALAIVGIKDPVRAEVPGAVATCQKAGITVRMVTGDNIHTARHIARECGILTENGIALEGPDFRSMPIQQLLPMLPRVQVLARSSPEDKLTLVSLLKHHEEVVAVTGDGTNDAPALKESDVGLAMGIAGTEVAKEAADIVILDDNFSSCVKAVLWGRNVFVSIRKFLMFQLTVNFVALVVSFVGALVGGRMPLNVLQLLWVNLIMDTMGALALATENPSPELLDEKPHGRRAPLINGIMFKHIVTQGFYQIFWMFLFLYGLPRMPQYAYTPTCEFYGSANGQLCLDTAAAVGVTGQRATDTCTFINQCGFVCGSKTSTTCPLAAGWGANPPSSVNAALCPNGDTTNCQAYSDYKAVKDALGRELYAQHDKDFLKIASVLFNTFIFAQIFNLVNARRINDEYNVFADLHKSHIFLIILGVILLAQVLIINFMGMFFKVQPISWKEWLVTVAIGSGALVWSFIVRFLSRNTPLFNCGCLAAVLGRYNKVQVKSEAAANAVYNNPNTTLSVQEAVTAVRAGLKAAEEAAAAAEEQKEQAEQEKKKKGSWLGLTKLGAGKGKAKSKEERTLSGRSDSAGSLV